MKAVVAAFNQEKASDGTFSSTSGCGAGTQTGANFATEISAGMREGRSHCLLPELMVLCLGVWTPDINHPGALCKF